MSTSETPINLHKLNLHIHAADDATTVRCTGRLTIDTSPQLKSEVKPLLVNKRRVILDLTDLAHMDSSGLGALVALYVSARASGCELQMVNLSPRIRELLSMTNIISLFESCGRYGTRLP
jgi:anti-anti-sigma factor